MLWLLRFGGFLKANWKIIAIIVAVLGAYFWYKGQLKQAYMQGKADCSAEWLKRIDNEDKKNRAFETRIQNQLDSFESKRQEQENTRIVKETTHKETIKEIIKDNPDLAKCVVPQEVLDERNAIRRLGPQGPRP